MTTGELPSCPNATIWKPSCKRRDCPVCGVRWARDWYRVMRFNLEEYGKPVALLSITAPGAERLPWDRSRCTHGPGVACAGKHGCKIEDRALREWACYAVLRLQWLRRAAYQATKRAGYDPPPWLDRVWEPQKRGAPHVHVVIPFGSPAERDAAHAYVNELARLAPRYDFGKVDRGKWSKERKRFELQPKTGAEAARYLANYLTGRNARRKDSIRDNIADPRLPRSLVWLSPKLTSLRQGGTGVTMRTMRRARHLWAALEGVCPQPSWQSAEEAALIALVFRRLFRAKKAADEPPLADVLTFARRIDRRFLPCDILDRDRAREQLATMLATAA